VARERRRGRPGPDSVCDVMNVLVGHLACVPAADLLT